jgi:hypothetical protein
MTRMVAFNTEKTDSTNVGLMSADERLAEVADILATGLLRLRFRTRVTGDKFLGNSTFGLEVGRRVSPHVDNVLGKERAHE